MKLTTPKHATFISNQESFSLFCYHQIFLQLKDIAWVSTHKPVWSYNSFMKKVANAESLKAALDYFQMVPESTSGNMCKWYNSNLLKWGNATHNALF